MRLSLQIRRYRLAWVMGLTLVGAIAALYALSSAILLNSFAQVERQKVKEDLDRTVYTINYELTGLNRVATDYAAWDDTYTFVQDRNPDYVKVNLDVTYANADLDVIALLDPAQTFLYKGLSDSTREKILQLSPVLQTQLTQVIPSLRFNKGTDGQTGLLFSPDGLMLLAIHPILKSDKTGASRGNLVFGRYLNAEKVAELNQVTHLAIAVYSTTDSHLPQDVQQAISALAHRSTVVQPLSSESIAGYTLLKDIYGNPSIVLRITTSRVISQQGRVSAQYLGLSLLGGGSMAGLVIALLLRSLVHNWRERDRLEQSLLQETALRQSEEKYRQKAEELQRTLQDLQQAQAQLVQSEKMSSLGQLVAGVAHEINNPISFVYGNIGHLSSYVNNLLTVIRLYQHRYPAPDVELQTAIQASDFSFILKDLPKVMNSMQMGVERVQDIVLSLRNFSRLDESDMKFVDIHEGLDNTLLILQSRFKASGTFSGITLVKDYGELPWVECYAGQLNQVFMNLLVNGIDAMEAWVEHGAPSTFEPTLTIRTEVLGANWIGIRIADNGPGIPQAVQPKLFDPFFTTKPVGKGTGLGLAICYQIVVDKHRGQIGCISVAGEGAEFIVQIPVAQRSPLEPHRARDL